MPLIAITGKIASGKSTVVKLLTTSNIEEFPYKIKYIDLDQYCKSIKDNIPDLKEFFKKEFNLNSIPTSDFIVTEIFNDYIRYKKYCACFVSYIIKYLEMLQYGSEEVYVVEASAYFSYPEIHHLFSSVINVYSSYPLRSRNIKSRNIAAVKVDIIDSLFPLSLQGDNIVSVSLDKGTFQELRGKSEEALIRACGLIKKDPYLDEGIKILDYFRMHFNKHSFNDNPYHNIDHTRNVLTHLIFSGKFTKVLGLAAIYHDYGYLPKVSTNEERSCSLAHTHLTLATKDPKFDFDPELIDKVCYYVRNSGFKDVERLIDDDLDKLFLSDVASFIQTNEEIIENSKLLFKEYSFYDWPSYKKGHIEILKQIKSMRIIQDTPYKTGIDLSISLVNNFEPKIGWFCGSFNPFTIGHLDILEKAEKQFDKIVIVQAINPVKELPHSIEYIQRLSKYEIISRVIVIPPIINDTLYTPTLIRGIRDSKDVDESINWINCINEFTKETIQCIMILGDPKLSHVSSSFVRNAKELKLNVSKFIIE
jgi:pantetheine-phosphate adenylyltransferase